MKTRFGLWFLVAAMGAGCGQDTDNTAPTVSLTSLTPAAITADVCGAPADNVVPITGGQSIEIAFAATDDEALGQYKIDIHDDFDCHGHEGERSALPAVFTLQDIVDISGTSQNVSRSIVIPADVRAGNYHFQVSLLDAAGNENATAILYTLQVRNPSDLESPVVVVDAPSGDLTLSRGQTLTVSGTASDNLALNGGHLELVYHTPSGDRRTAQTYQFAAADGSAMNFNLEFVIPSDFVAGEYEFELLLVDAVGNTEDMDFKVIVP